jgi:nitroimidazol reductase NimA-like FMN-containing flavoprotein (pyridoxamine 5'-phosphate oxidase superfamily)
MLGKLDQERIEEILRQEVVGRIGCHAEGRTYVVPITYVYADGCAYAHSPEGMKLRFMRANPRVCFEVDRVRSPTEWESVIAWGVFEELAGEEAHAAMRRYIDRLGPMLLSGAARLHGPMHPQRVHPPGDGQGAVVYRLRLTERTGRFEGSRPPARSATGAAAGFAKIDEVGASNS